jgi:FkbM family methyltransferase
VTVLEGLARERDRGATSGGAALSSSNILKRLRLKIAGSKTATWPYSPQARLITRLRLWVILVLYRCGVFSLVDTVRDYLGWYPDLPSYSQFEEDRFILNFFGGKPGVYIDVGAFHPWRISNTYLLYQHGWSGVTIEPIPRLFDKHKHLRGRDIQLNAAVGDRAECIEFMELVPAARSTFDRVAAVTAIKNGYALQYKTYSIQVLPLSDIYQRTIFPKSVDLLTIDVEGSGLNVLKSIDFGVLRPRMIVLEMNDDAGDEPMRECLRSQGYETLNRFGCNEIFCGR